MNLRYGFKTLIPTLVTACLGVSPAFAVSFNSTVWNPSGALPAASGTGTLPGTASPNTLTYNTTVVSNSGQTFDTAAFPPSWNASLATNGGGTIAYSSNLAGVLGTLGTPDPQSVTFTGTAVNPVLMFDFAGAGTVIVLPAGSTLLSSNNCILTGVTVTCAGATRTASDGFAVKVNGTFGPGTPVNFSYADTGSRNTIGFSVAGIAAPSLTKTFGTNPILAGATTSIVFVINNPNTFQLTALDIRDVLPLGVTKTGSIFPGPGCGGLGTDSSTTTVIHDTGHVIPAASSCTLTVTGITAPLPGSYPNTSDPAKTAEAPPSATATDTLLVVVPPTVTKTFSGTKIAPGGTSNLSITISNPNTGSGLTLTNVAFTDNLPGAMTVAATASGPACFGTLTATATTSVITLAGGIFPAGLSCTITVLVTAPEGQYSNSVFVTAAGAGLALTSNTATATLSVASPPTISKTFGSQTTLAVGNTVGLTFTVRNPNTATTLTGIAFNDPLPAGLKVASPSVVTGVCDAGAITAVANAGTISLGIPPPTASLLPGASCTFTVSVKADGTFVGQANNLTDPITSDQSPAGGRAAASIFIGNPYQLSYAANLAAGDSFVNISNSGVSGAALQSGTVAGIVGSICVNVYAFSPDEQMVSCCSCPVTPNGLVSLSAKTDLASNTLTPAVPTALVIKLVATAVQGTPGVTSGPNAANCNNSAATVGLAGTALANGLAAFSTTIHATPTAGAFGVTDPGFASATLSAGEATRLGSLCNFIIANGSGFGICRSCRLGGLGAERQ